MDFASLMKSQIASSKPKEEGAKKYLKRSEIEAQRESEYQREQARVEQERLERLDKKRKREDEEAERNRAREEKRLRLAEESRRLREEEEEAEERARRKRLGLPELVKKDGKDSTPLKDGEEDIAEEELLEKLKGMGEPRFLFGETHLQRLRRYRRLTDKVLAPKLSNGPIPTTIELLPEKDMKVPERLPKDPEQYKFLLRQLASYFDMLLSEWQNALARRPQEVKASATGKQAYNSFLAAKDNLKPLFKKLESNNLEPSIQAPILEIVRLAQTKRYVDANDAYLRLSIGKAAWPIGVTMVGIHERSAREKLHETDNQAHILSDETTRKMLQGIKRCLSYAQTRWPPDDIGQLMG
jgi:pre-mRNA-splicing factor 18